MEVLWSVEVPPAPKEAPARRDSKWHACWSVQAIGRWGPLWWRTSKLSCAAFSTQYHTTSKQATQIPSLALNAKMDRNFLTSSYPNHALHRPKWSPTWSNPPQTRIGYRPQKHVVRDFTYDLTKSLSRFVSGMTIITGISQGRLTTCTCARGHLLHIHVESTPSQHESTNIKLTPSLTKQGLKNLKWLLSIHNDIIEGAWRITAGAFSTQTQWNKRILCPKSQATESCPGCHQQTIFLPQTSPKLCATCRLCLCATVPCLVPVWSEGNLRQLRQSFSSGTADLSGDSDEWLPNLDCTSQTVQDCPHTDGHPSSHNHGKWTMTTSY